MWDDEIDDSPVQTVAPVSNIQGSGFGIGRGRGFGLSSLNNALPEVGSKNFSSNPGVENSGWEEDSGWNDTPSNNNTTWQDNNNFKSNDDWGSNQSRKYNENNHVRGGGFGSNSGKAILKNQSGNNKSSRNNRLYDKRVASNAARGNCHKCGESGHMARDCTSGGNRRGGGGCFKCGKEGHLSRDCTESTGGDNRSKSCFKCHEEGHMSRDCPNSGGGGSGCHKCGEEGHISRNCPNGGGGGNRSSGCRKCGEEGHIARNCPDGGGDADNRKKGCFKCGQDGHMARDCPDGDEDGNKRKGCFKCGEDGHMAKDCTNPESNIGPDGKPRPPLYIPPDPTDNVNEMYESTETGINFSKYETIPVDASGRDVPSPINSFDNAGLCQLLLKNVRRMGYNTPTPVQKHAIPIISHKRDLMACAQTGSGKTAAFLLPMLNSMIADSKLPNNSDEAEQKPLAVIMSPTRELALQIACEGMKFANDSVVRVEVIYGGTSTGHQYSRIKRGCHILVATPGRLLDFVEKGRVSFSQLRYLVLDEADRMLDMGFLSSIRQMIEDSSMPQKGARQTLMFSATFPQEIQELASTYLEDYVFLTVGRVGAANTDVEQKFFKVGQYEKRQKLMDILAESGTDRVLVFVEQKRTADFLASFTSQNGISTTSIHGDRLQREREEALRDFRSGLRPVLVATAVAARGLDIKGVQHVINYDLPQSIDEYVHRIGRTGRVGNLGKATSFYDSNSDQPLARSLKKILMDAQQEVPDWLSEDATHAVGTSVQQYSGRGNFGGRDMRSQGNPSKSSSDAWNDSNSHTNNAYNAPVDADEAWD